MALSTLKTSTSEDELWQSSGSRNASVNVHKFPIRRLKPTIHKFQKVLQIDLERLQKHRNNIDRLTVLEDWVGLHKEQVNASRTIQQVKATLRDLERTRAQVFDEDLDQFDEQLQDVKIQAVMAVDNFLRFSQADSLQPEAFVLGHSGDVDTRESTSLPCILNSPRSPVHDLPFMQTQLEMHHVPDNSQAAASAEELLKDIQELNELVHQFANLVKQQGEAVDKIEDNLEQASVNVREGTLSLAKASRYKVAAFPIFGAIVGAAMAGPVGLVAGAKIGGLAGAGLGGLAGLTGGSFLKHRHNKVLEMEMKNLEEQSRSPHRSNSTPELSVPLDHPPGTEDPQSGTQQASQSIFTNFFPWRLRQTQSQSDE